MPQRPQNEHRSAFNFAVLRSSLGCRLNAVVTVTLDIHSGVWAKHRHPCGDDVTRLTPPAIFAVIVIGGCSAKCWVGYWVRV